MVFPPEMMIDIGSESMLMDAGRSSTTFYIKDAAPANLFQGGRGKQKDPALSREVCGWG
jgi:hypothetical protein